MNEVLTQRGISHSALMLSVLTFFFIFSFSLTSASKWDSGSMGKFDYTPGIIPVVPTENITFNTTQFEQLNNVTSIKISWLKPFIESISKWTDYFTKTEILNFEYYNKSTTQIKLTELNMKNDSYGIWSNNSDIVIGYIEGL